MKFNGNTGFSTYERTDEIEVGDTVVSEPSGGPSECPGFFAFSACVVAKYDIERGMVTIVRPMAYVRDSFMSVHLSYEQFVIEDTRLVKYYVVFTRGASGKKMQFLV